MPHSGFNIHNRVEIDADDTKGRETPAQYIIKATVSQERMIYDKKNQKVIYKSKHGTIVYDPLDWLCCEFSDPLTNKGILEFVHPKCIFVYTN
ncbi:hypothetical protein JXL19_13220, partial [bacterium]|nr:hypothetical protein [bacterium]